MGQCIAARCPPRGHRHNRPNASADLNAQFQTFCPLTFTLTSEGEKHRATCTGHGRAHKVNRFTQQDAERLARACNARAAFWADAAREEAATLRRHIATLDAASAA